jgi:hypothetical protein
MQCLEMIAGKDKRRATCIQGNNGGNNGDGSIYFSITRNDVN